MASKTTSLTLLLSGWVTWILLNKTFCHSKITGILAGKIRALNIIIFIVSIYRLTEIT